MERYCIDMLIFEKVHIQIDKYAREKLHVISESVYFIRKKNNNNNQHQKYINIQYTHKHNHLHSIENAACAPN